MYLQSLCYVVGMEITIYNLLGKFKITHKPGKHILLCEVFCDALIFSCKAEQVAQYPGRNFESGK